MADTKVIVIPEGKICDYIDGKFRNDTPEEYVRQTVEKRLVNEHKYFPEQIRVEYTLQLGSRKPRADIVIFESKDTAQTQENIKIIIECKKETVDARNDDNAGYIYAYLKSKIGQQILLTNSYGAVITHIEPEHLADVPIPNAPVEIKQEIHKMVIDSYALRDESNFRRMKHPIMSTNMHTRFYVYH